MSDASIIFDLAAAVGVSGPQLSSPTDWLSRYPRLTYAGLPMERRDLYAHYGSHAITFIRFSGPVLSLKRGTKVENSPVENVHLQAPEKADCSKLQMNRLWTGNR